ncbi:efflux transporter outer membrane subunit [Burkholderia plantarii]|uniref:RND efflux transporter, outer membrane factor (OMF) lipoprotein, NodT family n=1 Tax=Burkholderia plantarii TaxID=41899 RepID=A0A0B6S6F0_BURPL|nr:RND efflux transporter, outer membrane factor (OMF) lipoprotein, NodT family [Burkholderia plantarii]
MSRPIRFARPARAALAGGMLAAGIVLGGCVPSGFQTTVAPHVPAADALAGVTGPRATDGAWPAPDWVRQLGDAQLDALVAEAYENNPTLQAARARIAIAQAQLQQYSAMTGLVGTAGASVTKARVPRSDGVANVNAGGFNVPVDLFGDPGISSSSLYAGLNYQLDLWGANAAATRGFLSSRDAARVDAEQARLTLAVSLVTLYCELDQVYAQRELLEQKRAAGEQIDAVLRERAARGIDNAYDASDAAIKRSRLLGQIASAGEQIRLIEVQIGVMTGKGPERGLALARPHPGELVDAPLPAQLPVELLGRRPDIVAARLRVQAAFASVDGARADFYPNVNLSAIGGLFALTPAGLLRGKSFGGSIGPAVSLPIFERGRLKAKLAGDVANADLTIALYNQTVDEALGQVARQLTQLRTMDTLLAGQQQAVDAAQRIVDIAEERHRRGFGMEKDVNNARLTLADERTRMIDLLARRRALRIGLIDALGGGFDASRLPGPAIAGSGLVFPAHDRLTDSHFD